MLVIASSLLQVSYFNEIKVEQSPLHCQYVKGSFYKDTSFAFVIHRCSIDTDGKPAHCATPAEPTRMEFNFFHHLMTQVYV